MYKQTPVIVTSKHIFFPKCTYEFHVTEQSQIEAIERLAIPETFFVLVTHLQSDAVDSKALSLPHIGTMCSIKKFTRTDKGITATVQPIVRALVKEFSGSGADISCMAKEVHDDVFDLPQREGRLIIRLKSALRRQIKEIAQLDSRISSVVNGRLRALEKDIPTYVDAVADFFLSKTDDRRELLEELDLIRRIDKLSNFLVREFEHIKIAQKISGQTRVNLDKQQKEYFLREQMKVIGDELGDDSNEIEELYSRADNLGAPQEVIDKVKKDIGRLSKTNTMSPELGVLRNYIETVLDLPWKDKTVDEADLALARQKLDEDHYNMSDVKDRIIEHIAVMQLNENLQGQILCFVGPPGVGKTSIAESVARALNRQFVRVSLGGVRDEAEIRGHRRTYVGAMPGKVIAGMKKAKSKNPVFLFDEIDKLSHDTHRGDPSSAMLEVLDPVQNKTFHDHYLDVPFDLSSVLFICTANDESMIPWALQDRMEIINLSSYTLVEKLLIARNFLFPKLCKEHGIPEKMISFTQKGSTDALSFLIEGYTREAGVRELGRVISRLLRRIAIKIVNGELKKGDKIIFDQEKIIEYMEKEKYSKDDITYEDAVGVINGLSYTAVGGDVLKLEVALLPGKGELHLTGRLGDVMKESAQIALSVTKSLAKDFNIDISLFETKDVHIHVPSGAVPKDGPSAGVALTTALISAFSGKKIRGNFAMTGEVTLSGRVLEVGGIREKLLSAYRYGIPNVIIPTKNQKSLDKVPAEALKKIKVSFADSIQEILHKTLI